MRRRRRMRMHELLPDSPEVHLSTALNFEDKGSQDDAIASYVKAPEAAAGQRRAHYNLGNLLKEKWSSTRPSIITRRRSR